MLNPKLDDYEQASEVSSAIVSSLIRCSIFLAGAIAIILLFVIIASVVQKFAKPPEKQLYIVQSGYVEICPK